MAGQMGLGGRDIQTGGLHEKGQLDRATCGGQQGQGPLGRQISEVAQDAQGPVFQLAVGDCHIDHAVAVNLAQPDHHTGRQNVEGHFGGRARLEPGGTGEQLGSGQQANVDVAGHRGLLSRHAGHGHGERTDRLRHRQATQHVGGGAAGGDPHQTIAPGKPPLVQIVAAGLGLVLQAFGTAQQGRGAPRQNPLHQLGI